MNLGNQLKEIGKSILIAIVLLAIAFILIGYRCDTKNWTFITLGIVVLIPFGIVYLYHSIKSSKQKNKDHL